MMTSSGWYKREATKQSHSKNSHPNTESLEISSLTTQTTVRRVKMKTVHLLQMEEPSMSCLMGTTTRVMTELPDENNNSGDGRVA